MDLHNISSTCRICLQHCEVAASLFDYDETGLNPILSILKNSMYIKLDRNKQLPHHVCSQCEAEVYLIWDFKQKIDRSTKYLHERFYDKIIPELESEWQITNDTDESNNDVVIIENTISDIIEIADELIPKSESIEDSGEIVANITCKTCKLAVPSRLYKRHLRKHFINLHCEKCNGKKFSNSYNLKRHNQLHTKQELFACEKCGQKFDRGDKLKEHEAVHQLVHICECKTTFDNEETLKQHQETECSRDSSGAKYKRFLSCDACTKTFSLPSSLQTHKLLHTEQREVCQICGNLYPNKQKLDTHVMQVHMKQPNARKHFCSYCTREYSSRGALERHARQHFQGTGLYKCKLCNRTFTQSGSLSLHMLIHSGEKPFVCDKCPSRFNKPCNLRRHLRSHENIKPYICPVCEKTFTVKHTLIIHQRIHTGEKPFPCTKCTKSFVDRGSLKKHSKVHEK